LVVRSALLLVTLVSLYVVWPSLVAVFASFPDLRSLSPVWFGLMVLLEAVSFACIWALQALLLGTRRWGLIATAQLAGNAFGRIVPVGAAAGGALQYRMLTDGGIDGATVGSGLTASTLISTATLTAMPVVSVVAVLGGLPIARGLRQAATLGGAVFVVFVGLGALLVTRDGAVRRIGRFVEAIMRRLPVGPRMDERDALGDRLLEIRDAIVRRVGARWWEALLFAAGNWTFDYFALLAALTAVGAKPHPSLVILAYVAAAVLGMIPLTPGGLGFVEAGLTGTLSLAGIPSAKAVVATLAYRLVSYWLPLLVGPVAAVVHVRRFGTRRRTKPRP
jgi:uncharacterized protein (TIRG00374 family)